MPDRGKLVVLSFFLLALALAGGAMWYHFAKTRWAMNFWGADAARLIVRAPEVEVWRLGEVPDFGNDSTETDPNVAGPDDASQSFLDGDASEKTLLVDGSPLSIVRRRPLMAAPGLIHMRMALVEDVNFDPAAKLPAQQSWDYAFRFFSPRQELVVLIDSQQGLVRALGEPGNPNLPIASIAPIADGLKRFLEEQFSSPTDEPAPTAEKRESL